MKHTLFILALITASIQTFAQSPRIKLNQITKDSLTGSVLISSPTDSGMVYSRDLFISYGADTVLILNGDTLAATSGIISSVLSDGVTITGDGTTGSELTVDTATVIATKGDLDLYYLDSNPDGYTSNTGTVTSVAATAGTGISVSGSPITTSGTLNITNTAPDQTVSIAGGGINAVTGTYPSFTVTGTEVDGSVTNEGSLTVGAGGANDAVISSNTSGSSDVTISGGTNVTVTESGQTITIASSGGGSIPVDTFVTIAGTETITGAKTFSTGIVVNEDGNNVDTRFEGDTEPNLLFLDASADRVGIGITSPEQQFDIYTEGADPTTTFQIRASRTGYGNVRAKLKTYAGGSTSTDRFTIDMGSDEFSILSNDNVGIGTTSPSEKLDVDGNARFRSIGSGASAGALHYTSTGVLTTNTSDVRLKTNLQPLQNTLNKLLDINTYTFNWINETDRVDLGMVAQEVEEIFPRLVFTNPVDGYKGIHYDKFSSILTKAIQEQQAIIESIQTELNVKSSIIKSQATEIEQLKTLITELNNRLTILENN